MTPSAGSAEEFLLVIPECGREGALLVAERLRAGVADHTIPHEGKMLAVTLSVGVAWADAAARIPGIDTMMAVADKALYRAKDAGRNCVRLSTAD